MQISREVKLAALALCEGLATPVSLSVKMLIEAGEWDQVSLKRVNPLHYLDAEAYWRDASAVNFLRKYDALPTSFNREEKAYDTFYACEKECFRTNERLSPFLFGAEAPEDGACRTLIGIARKNLRSWLGSAPHLNKVEGRFGPGSTYGDKGHLSTVPDKMSSKPTLTTTAGRCISPWLDTAWARACAVDGRSPVFVPGNRFTAVPKDSSKFRGIAIEPSLNLFYQLGFGRVIRRRLLSQGLNLRDGKDIHAQVAREASIRGHMSTIDLSNASDTVCSNLVKLLLPVSWYEELSALRSPTTLIGGKVVRLEKFSSMGNGFTFELETAIFAAICSAVLEMHGHIHWTFGLDLFVFGDDMIVPSECADDIISALRFFGLTPNREKSYIRGPFRESCGGDYFDGTDVRSYYLKKLPNEPQHFISMANGLREVADPNGHAYSRFSRIRNVWFSILALLPSSIRRLRGPKDLGDLVIHDEPEYWNTRTRHSIRFIRCYRPARFMRVGWEHFKPEVVLATALLGAGDGLRGVMPRKAVLGYKIGWVARS